MRSSGGGLRSRLCSTKLAEDVRRMEKDEEEGTREMSETFREHESQICSEASAGEVAAPTA